MFFILGRFTCDYNCPEGQQNILIWFLWVSYQKKKKLKNDHPKVHLGFPFVSEVPTCSVTHKKDSQDSAYICTHSCSLLQGQQGRKTQVESEEVHLRASSALSLPWADTPSMLPSLLAKSTVIHMQYSHSGESVRDSATRFLLEWVMRTPFTW